MGSVLLGRANRNQQRWPLEQALPDCPGGHFLEPRRALRLSHRERWWVVVVLAASGTAAEWLRHPSPHWVAISLAAFLAGVIAVYPLSGWRRAGLVLALLGLASALGLSQWRLSAIETRWPEQRELRVSAASRRLAGDLHAAFHRAEQ